jgi:hypothetical protein
MEGEEGMVKKHLAGGLFAIVLLAIPLSVTHASSGGKVFLQNHFTSKAWQQAVPNSASDAATGSSAQDAATSSVTVTVDRSVPAGVSRLNTGITHEHYSLDAWGDPAAVAQGKSLLEASASFQNQHIYGWGTLNPEPVPGVFDWTTLDERVALMRSMHAQMVITLCCAPDWMTSLGTNTSTYPNIPPTSTHVADFAALAREIALRYPDVRYFQVWNEMKGYWDDATNNWNYVAYTNLYNAVYDALKGVNPGIQVGGPYLVIEGTGSNAGDWSQAAPLTKRNMQVLDYWLANKHGADFICLDRGVHDYHDHAKYTPDQLMSLTGEFQSIADQVRRRTSLPIWWSEHYFVGSDNWGFQAAGFASLLLHELEGGSSVSLTWAPQGVAGDSYRGNQESLFSDTRVVGGGQPFPYYWAFKTFHDDFGPGTQLYQAVSSAPDVEALASSDHILLINKRGTPVTADVNGQPVQLGAYEVRALDS